MASRRSFPAGSAGCSRARAPLYATPLRRGLLAGAACALLLSGCGQKGPLYLPNAQKAPVVPTPGAATPSVVPAEPAPLAPAAKPATPDAGSGAGAPASQPAEPGQSAPPALPNDSRSAPDGSRSTDGNSPAA
ncbi:MAG TPA: lipoprotein [Steroidobacteraceae bacterium]|jgi:predicted small lipoprotein YifL